MRNDYLNELQLKTKISKRNLGLPIKKYRNCVIQIHEKESSKEVMYQFFISLNGKMIYWSCDADFYTPQEALEQAENIVHKHSDWWSQKQNMEDLK
tara:strand:- start:166 stop:453 length:288 start_codon:yes stop_codon:yes gene_type:complete